MRYFQIWLKPWRIEAFRSISNNTGRTQVEIFERMTEMYENSDEYKELVKLNNKRKKHNAIVASALILLIATTLSLFFEQHERVDLASSCNLMGWTTCSE
jgi:transposase-like protein